MKFSCDDLYGQTERAISSLVQRDVHQHCDQLAGLCESPIEVMLGCGLLVAMQRAVGAFYRQAIITRAGWSVDDALVTMTKLDRDGVRLVFICPQLVVEDYRVDFGVLFAADYGRICGIAIECDGHDFHYGDRETVARDRKRDRDLQDLGFTVKRFPGADIHRDLEGCVDDVWGTVFQAAYDDMREVPPKGIIAEPGEGESVVVFGRRRVSFTGHQLPMRSHA